MLTDLLYRVRTLFRRAQINHELDEELRFHFDHQVEANLHAGMSPQEARRQARLKLGGHDQLKEDTRDAHGVRFLESLAQDLRFGARMLYRSPAFTLVAVLTLALGIGTNVAIFSYVDAWLIQGLPYPHSDQLTAVKARDVKKGLQYDALTPGDVLSLAEESKFIAAIAAFDSPDFNLTGDGTPERVAGASVNSAFFDVLGVKPVLGRTFLPSEDRPGANHVAILSRGLWANRYAGDPQIIGRKITIDGDSYTVVGVLPDKFQFPLVGIANVWTPMAWNDTQRAAREGAGYSVIARMNPGANFAVANQELAAISARLESAYPATNENELFYLMPLKDEIARQEGGTQVLICFWIVGLVLLIACANVANLMLARASARTKEMAMRNALGASRARIARQLLTESAILFTLGGAAGILFGALGMNWVDSLIPDRSRGYLVNYGHVQLDLITFVYAFGLALLCGIIFGLAPALQASKVNVNGVLKEASGQIAGGKRGLRIRRIFVAGEIAVAVLVLISTALLVQSFVHMAQADPGFRPANLIATDIALPQRAYSSDASTHAFYEQALARVRALPQVESASVTQVVPFSGHSAFAKIYRADRPKPQPNDTKYAQSSAITPEYFDTMKITLLSGRPFSSADSFSAAPVVIVSNTLARQFWADGNPVGQQIVLDDAAAPATVVGVVADVQLFGTARWSHREVFVPFAQVPALHAGIVVRAAGNPESLAAPMRDAIWSVDSQLPVSEVKLLTTMIHDSYAPDGVLSQLAIYFGLLALFLGALGIYGVMAHSVARRTNEIGIRVALGASPRQVVELVIAEGLKVAAAGIVAGAILALALTRMMASILFNVKTSDPVIFTSVAVLFAAVAIAACAIPAWRALRIDPTVALRYE